MSQEQLSCSICLELYDDPVRLACFHVFCEKCITDNINIPHRNPVCPECNAQIDSDDPLRKDFIIAGLVQSIRDAPKCSEHNDEIDTLEECRADILCRVCCKLLCVKCAFSGKHKNHEMDDLKSAVAKQKDLFARKIPGVKRKLEDYSEQLADTKKTRTELVKCELDSRLIFKRMITGIQLNIDKLKTNGEQAIQDVADEWMNLCKEKKSKLAEKVKYGEELVKSHNEFEKDIENTFKVLKDDADNSSDFYNASLPDLPKKPSAVDIFKSCPVIEENFAQLHSLVNNCWNKIKSCSSGSGKNKVDSGVFSTKHSAAGEEYSTPKVKSTAGKKGENLLRRIDLNKQNSKLSSRPSSEADSSVSDLDDASPSTSLMDRPDSPPGTSGESSPFESALPSSSTSAGPSSSTVPEVALETKESQSSVENKDLSDDVNAAINLIAEANFSTQEFSEFLIFFQKCRKVNNALSTTMPKKGFAMFALQHWKRVQQFKRNYYRLEARNTEKYQRALQEYTSFFS